MGGEHHDVPRGIARAMGVRGRRHWRLALLASAVITTAPVRRRTAAGHDEVEAALELVAPER